MGWKTLIKRTVQAIALVVVFPGALFSGFGRVKAFYILAAQSLALVPGLPGSYLRAAFYRLTLARCSQDCTISFGTYFSQTEARVDPFVSIGSYCVIGRASIGERTQIASHVEIPSGRHEHAHDAEGRFVDGVMNQVIIGPFCWIGASAVIMANVGDRSIVGAGSVVVKDIPPDSVAAGNPARVIRSRLERAAPAVSQPS